MKFSTDVGPIHFIGIGGIGMSGIAELLKALGYAVQGSDMIFWRFLCVPLSQC